MDLDNYDIYNIEYSDNILNTYYKIVDYCDPAYVNIHNKPNFSEFFNIVYRNVDVYNSSQVIKKMNKIEEQQEEDYESDLEYNY
tara:strand:+ start:1104 stop:1355 length:252 start_codon:yes stop_codon:yes gene_type:complete